jgi:uncharacterized membrane protein HdeD (DUF308 family)
MSTLVYVRTRDWWLLAIRGIAAILFGLAAFAWPGLTIAILVIFFGAFAVVDGAIELSIAWRRRGANGWRGHLVQGLVGIIAGLVALVLPGVAALALILIIAAWAVVTGIIEIFLAFELRERLRSEWLWALTGLASILFGLALFLFPAAGAVAMAWLIGAYALVVGILLVALGLALRSTAPAFP